MCRIQRIQWTIIWKCKTCGVVWTGISAQQLLVTDIHAPPRCRRHNSTTHTRTSVCSTAYPTAAASSALPSIEMKIMSTKSTRNTAINPTEDVSDITEIWRNKLPLVKTACVSLCAFGLASLIATAPARLIMHTTAQGAPANSSTFAAFSCFRATRA